MIKLTDVHIHILEYGNNPSAEEIDRWLFLLSKDEQERYAGFELKERRREFLLSRLLLRWCLGRYLKKDMTEISIKNSGSGKPFVETAGIHFNLSHTDRWIACSFAKRPVGIDLENIAGKERKKTGWEAVANRFFSSEEREYMWAQPVDSRIQAFLRIFTMKEAYLKALGEGIRAELASFNMPISYRKRSKWGPWEFFIKTNKSIGYCLSHAAWNTENISLKYHCHEWKMGSFFQMLKCSLGRNKSLEYFGIS